MTEEQFPLELIIYRITEANLQEVFELDFVKSQFDLHVLRIDILPFDRDSAAFVKMEYKKDRNFSVLS